LALFANLSTWSELPRLFNCNGGFCSSPGLWIFKCSVAICQHIISNTPWASIWSKLDDCLLRFDGGRGAAICTRSPALPLNDLGLQTLQLQQHALIEAVWEAKATPLDPTISSLHLCFTTLSTRLYGNAEELAPVEQSSSLQDVEIFRPVQQLQPSHLPVGHCRLVPLQKAKRAVPDLLLHRFSCYPRRGLRRDSRPSPHAQQPRVPSSSDSCPPDIHTSLTSRQA